MTFSRTVFFWTNGRMISVCSYNTSDTRSKYRKSLEVWCWRRTEKISSTDRVKNKKAVRSQGVIERLKCKKWSPTELLTTYIVTAL